jgi:exopolysaccharide biosynthesis polyprenyl glycosylphosphotransferase
MLKERAREIALLVALVDSLLLLSAFTIAYFFRVTILGPALGDKGLAPWWAFSWIVLVSIPLLIFLFRRAGLYDSLRRRGNAEVLWLTLKPFGIAFAVTGLLVFLTQDKTYSRAVFFGYFALGSVLVCAEKLLIRLAAKGARRRGYNTRHVLIVGANEDAHAIAQLIQDSPDLGYQVEGHLIGFDDRVVPLDPLPLLGHVRDLPRFLDHSPVDEVIIAVPAPELPEYAPVIRQCEEVGVTIHLKLDRFGSLLSRAYPSNLGEFPLVTLSSTPHAAVDVLAKRMIDLLIGTFVVILLSPVMLFTWLAIRLTSSGPALFRQVRMGLNGRPFVLYKFRSMRHDAEDDLPALSDRNEMDGPVFKMKRDPRVTWLGRIMRRWSLDELPQLFNVLKGDMSLVGPRPPIPDEVGRYERWQKRRLSMKPGLTCLWQVNGRNEVDFETWMKLDMEYIDNWSVGLDLKILARTIPAVLTARGAR